MQPIQITTQNYENEIVNSDIPVLVDFWAPWCGPCRMVSPIIEDLSNELNGRVKVAKVNIDEQPELAAKFEVMSIPTLAMLEKGRIKNVTVGAKSKHELKRVFGLN